VPWYGVEWLTMSAEPDQLLAAHAESTFEVPHEVDRVSEHYGIKHPLDPFHECHRRPVLSGGIAAVPIGH
jgi:hypothetical protein